ncbi:MAG TPA: VOC family protein [Pyrinomonadaceae bacterium]|nr:VOC family protein [Pyrinomonadaceae bacterium]
MPEVTGHVPGSFCWIELGTSDTEAAKKFYASLFGWEAEDTPVGPDMVYTMLRIRGLDIGAMYKLGKEETAHGIPPTGTPTLRLLAPTRQPRKQLS